MTGSDDIATPARNPARRLASLLSALAAMRPIRYPLMLAFWSSVLTLPFGIVAFTTINNLLPPHAWLDVYKHWDVLHYLELAEHGYRPRGPGNDRFLIVFLPLYPWSVRLVRTVIPNWHLAALFVSNFCGAGALVYLFLLAQWERSTWVAKRAVFYFAIFPTAYFLHLAYTESLFIFLTVAAFYHARRGQWLACGIFGMLATGARILGLAILPALAFEYLQQRNFRWREIRADVAWLALVPGGLLAYFYLNYRYFGDPLHFLVVQREHWSHYLRWPIPAVKSAWEGVIGGQATDRAGRFGPQLVAFAAGTLTLIFSALRLRPCFTIYVAITWVMIFCDNFTLSSPRYILSMFPLFLLLAVWAHRPWRHTAITFGFLLCYAIYCAQFARGWWAH